MELRNWIGHIITIVMILIGGAVAYGNFTSDINYNKKEIIRIEKEFETYSKDAKDEFKEFKVEISDKLNIIITKLNDSNSDNAITQYEIRNIKGDIQYIKKKMKY